VRSLASLIAILDVCKDWRRFLQSPTGCSAEAGALIHDHQPGATSGDCCEAYHRFGRS
jgi:hypothetical protein